MTNQSNQSSAEIAVSDALMWRKSTELLISALEILYPNFAHADLIGAANLKSLAAAENNEALPVTGRDTLTKYLDQLPYFRKGNIEEASRQHLYRTMQLQSLLAAR